MKFPDPWQVMENYRKLIDFIKETGGGGEGIQGVTSVIYNHKKWLYESDSHDGTEEELKEWLLFCFWLWELLPREHGKTLREDVGLRTLIYILCEEKTFYLCDDCRTPLVASTVDTDGDENDGCPWCGDCFNDNTNYKFMIVDTKVS